jgi:hypothetical protein
MRNGSAKRPGHSDATWRRSRQSSSAPLMSLFVVVTFVAGTSFGPAVSMILLPSQAACEVARKSAANAILDGQESNVPGARLVVANARTAVVQRSGRVSASLECIDL